ncbi:VanZ family protein (plasmid) [Paenibacillus cellulosilyticus]|nr:VanZ family protein [Paenibacillus cellulosilyticus]
MSTLILIVWVKGSSIHTTRLLYNFVPFRTIANYADFSSTRIAMNNLLGNFLLTAPLGFYSVFGIRLLPRSVNIVIYAILLPIIIEGVQLLLFTAGIGMRSVDIDDVILNALGCMLGYSLTKIIRGMLTSAVPLQKEKGEL